MSSKLFCTLHYLHYGIRNYITIYMVYWYIVWYIGRPIAFLKLSSSDDVCDSVLCTPSSTAFITASGGEERIFTKDFTDKIKVGN